MKKIERSTVLFTLSLLIILTLSILVSRFSYAYLESGPVAPGETKGQVVSKEDKMIFTKGDNISLSFNSATFTESKNATTKPSVTLIANNQTKSAVGIYSLGIKIDANTFKNTQENNPELILTVKDITGGSKEITAENLPESVKNSLNYVTVTDSNQKKISGFDITGKTGVFNFIENNQMTSTNYTDGVKHEFEFTITFVHYAFDQSINETATLSANAYISDVAETATSATSINFDEIVESDLTTNLE